MKGNVHLEDIIEANRANPLTTITATTESSTVANTNLSISANKDGTVSIWEEPPKDTSKEKKVYQMFGYDKHDGYSIRRFGIFESKELAEKYLMTASMAALGVPKYRNMVIEEAVINHITDNSAKRWFYKYIDERLDTNPPQYVGKYIEDHQSNSFFFELVYKFRTF